MSDAAEGRGARGFRVSDGAGFVAGAAVASVHLRVMTRGEGFGPGWPLIWVTFAWLTLTSAGPFVFALRAFGRGRFGGARLGERLWLLMGLPWLLTAPFQDAASTAAESPPRVEVVTLLSLGLGVACLVALVAIWRTWVAAPPDRADDAFRGPWTHQLGLILAIAWPFQCALGMVVLG